MQGRPVRIQGDPRVITEIAALVQETGDAEYLRTEEDDSGGIGADFALETVAAVVAIVSTLFFEGPIIPRLYAILGRHRGTRISIETPTRSASIESTEALSEESIRVILAELNKV